MYAILAFVFIFLCMRVASMIFGSKTGAVPRSLIFNELALAVGIGNVRYRMAICMHHMHYNIGGVLCT